MTRALRRGGETLSALLAHTSERLRGPSGSSVRARGPRGDADEHHRGAEEEEALRLVLETDHPAAADTGRVRERQPGLVILPQR